MKVSRFWSARRRALGILACLSVLGLALVACWQTDLVGKQIVKLKDSNPWVRIKAVRALRSIGLGSIKDPRAVEALIAALGDTDDEVWLEAAILLGDIKDPRAVEPLITALKDPDPGHRSVIVFVLGEIKDPAPKVRESAVGAVVKIKAPRVVELLIGALGDTDPRVRIAAVFQLREIDDPRAAGALMTALKDPEYGVREEAAKALPDDLLVKGLNKFGNREIAESFLRSGNQKLHNAASAWAINHGYRVE